MFKNMRVLVVGDICLDIIEEGISTRISSEAPVPVILNPTKKYALGMAGNTAVNLKSLGAEVYIATWIKLDKYGEKIIELLDEKGIKIRTREYESEHDNTTTVKKRVFTNGQQVARLDKEKFIKDEAFFSALKKGSTYEDLFFDFVIVSDYDKGYIDNITWPILLEDLKRTNKGRFFVDTKKKNVVDFYRGMYIFPNTNELKQLLNNKMTPNDLREFMNLDFLIQTASEKGAYLYRDNMEINFPTKVKEVIDVTGCGDTFISAFSLHYTKYKNLNNAINFANECSAIVAQKKGTAAVNINEVIK